VRAFITGATGFIGSHLCRRLLERGDEVVALVRNPDKLKRLPENVRVFRGDLGSFADERTELPQCDVFIHLAGVVTATTADDYDAFNFRAVKDLLGCLGRQKWSPRRLLFASSLAAAGPSGERPWSEFDAPQPIDAYGAAKARAEQALEAAPFPTTIFRPPIVFGPYDTATLTLFRSARRSVGFRVAGPPQRLSFVDVRDLVDGIARMADDERSGRFVYYVSHPQAFDVVELWRQLGRAVGTQVRVVPVPRWALFATMQVTTIGARFLRLANQLDEKQYAQMAAPAFVCSSERISRELGWQARHDLHDALTHAAQGYREAGMLS
jgi:nucleoside-diphosphate-sugar epimerase